MSEDEAERNILSLIQKKTLHARIDAAEKVTFSFIHTCYLLLTLSYL
tara:strand:+ start:198 stop:338 length:141 start_codon:yes stop_codon:yes gene_type:complete